MNLPDLDLLLLPPSHLFPLGLIVSPPVSSVSIWNTVSPQIVLCLFPQYFQLLKRHLICSQECPSPKPPRGTTAWSRSTLVPCHILPQGRVFTWQLHSILIPLSGRQAS